MKNLKLLFLIASFGMISLVGAQTPSFSVKGGLNMSNFSGDVEDNKMKPGFHVGVGVDLDFAPNMGIQTGLFYSTKGAKISYEDEGNGMVDQAYAPKTRAGANDDVTINANYLQLPVHFAYKIDVAPGTKVALHAGPYVAYGIGGKINGQGEETNTFDKDYGLKPFDAGLGLGVGAEFGKIIVDLGWDMGLINIMRDSEDDDKLKTQNAYVSIGYKF
ncbi:MAG: porin family protein [Dysgonamonadaceae bacterium]|nr:porin family protein [Dysgonamonadaceae bacterium]